eukprot:scaffold1356_cov123-Cylindrotheca_fusiformis.AAC.8
MTYSLLLSLMLLIWSVRAGYAPNKAPKLPEGFCPPETGDVTATTGGAKDKSSTDRRHLRKESFIARHFSGGDYEGH